VLSATYTWARSASGSLASVRCLCRWSVGPSSQLVSHLPQRNSPRSAGGRAPSSRVVAAPPTFRAPIRLKQSYRLCPFLVPPSCPREPSIWRRCARRLCDKIHAAIAARPENSPDQPGLPFLPNTRTSWVRHRLTRATRCELVAENRALAWVYMHATEASP
jgi:hypothetical protein